jgi:hypothetical protein
MGDILTQIQDELDMVLFLEPPNQAYTNKDSS